jgi:hypothetical protein
MQIRRGYWEIRIFVVVVPQQARRRRSRRFSRQSAALRPGSRPIRARAGSCSPGQGPGRPGQVAVRVARQHYPPCPGAAPYADQGRGAGTRRPGVPARGLGVACSRLMTPYGGCATASKRPAQRAWAALTVAHPGRRGPHQRPFLAAPAPVRGGPWPAPHDPKEPSTTGRPLDRSCASREGHPRRNPTMSGVRSWPNDRPTSDDDQRFSNGCTSRPAQGGDAPQPRPMGRGRRCTRH